MDSVVPEYHILLLSIWFKFKTDKPKDQSSWKQEQEQERTTKKVIWPHWIAKKFSDQIEQ
jgi:hypothetical protein